MADQQEPSQSQQQQQAPPQLTSRRGSLLNDTPFPETTTARVVTSAPVHTHTRKRSLSQLALRLLQPLTQDGSSSSTMTATPTSSAASSPFPSAAHTPPRSGSATPTSGSAAPQTTDPALMEATHQWSLSATDYAVGAAIGFGSSAIVYEALYLPLQKRVAIKMLDLDMFERNQIDELRKELQVMTLSRHPNLLPVLVSFVEESKLWIVTPYLGGGSCLDLLRNRFADGIADEAAVATVLRECLLGLEYLHRNHLLHRDVKAGNCLLAEDGGVMLADFGVSASLSEGGERGKHRKTFVGTPCWMAPEVLDPKKGGYDAKADIWSFGITAIELATGSAPYAKFAPLKVLMMTIANEPPTLDTSNCKWRFSRSFRDLIALCLQKDPTKRPTAAALLKHSFFRQAKKKEYLVKSLMKDLPAIGERQSSKRVPAATAEVKMEQRGMSWDFSSSTSLSDQDDSRSVSIVSSSSSSSSHSPSSDLAEAHGRIRSEGAAANAAASARRASDSRFVRGHARSHSTPIIAPVSSTGSSPAGTVQRGRFQVAAAIPEDATVSPPSPAVGAASIGASSPSTSKRRGRFTVTNVDAMHSSSDVDSDVNVAVASSKVVPSRGVSFASVRSSSISSTSSSSGGGMNSPGSTVASGATLSNALASAINTPLATDGPGVDALLEQAAQIRVTVPTALGQHSQSEEVVSLQERMLETIAQLERALRTTATRR